MKPNKISVVLLLLIAGICAAGISVKSVEPKGTLQINKAAINVILSCYKNEGNAVAIVGDVSNRLIMALSSQRIPIALIDDSAFSEVQTFRTDEFKTAYKLKVFVITITPYDNFRRLTLRMHLSGWWNNMASFLILYQSPQGCKGADIILVTAWVLSAINAKLMCFDRRLGTQILGYNPYVREAPKPWRFRETWSSRLDGITWDFLTFERSYRNGNGICKNLDFDKLKNLNGYPVEILFMSYSYRNGFESDSLININQKKGTPAKVKQEARSVNQIPKSTKNSGDYGGALIALLITTIRAMNGTPFRRIMRYEDHDNYLWSHRDLVHATAPLTIRLHSPGSRPFDKFELVILTHHRGYKTQLQKIFSVVDIYSNIGVGCALLGTLLFFKFFVLQPTMLAILNIVRMMCNTGFTNVPEDTPSRMVLTGILVFVVTMQGIYQGNLAALLTNEVPLPNIDTRPDLMNSDHEIYVQRGYEMFFTEPEIVKRLIVQEGKHDCTEHVMYNLSTACVSGAHNAMNSPHNVHVSKPFVSTLAVLVHRSNWQPAERFNKILGKLFEADLITSFRHRVNHQTLSDFLLTQELRNAQSFRNMTLSDLSFAFVILGFGLICSSITFVFEIIFYRITPRNRIKRVMVVPVSSTMDGILPEDEYAAKSMN